MTRISRHFHDKQIDCDMKDPCTAGEGGVRSLEDPCTAGEGGDYENFSSF